MSNPFSSWRLSAVVATCGLLAAVPATHVAAQTGSIAGTVSDERGSPLAGAQVLIEQIGKVAVTGTNGGYVLDAVAAGTHVLRVRLIGYRAQTQSVTVTAGARATQDFTLVPDPLNLEAVVVTGTEAPRTKLETSNAVTVLSAADVTQAAPRSTTEMLRYVPGFTRVESSGGEVNENISMRGVLGVEYVMFMEDGLPVFPTMHTFFMNADNLFRPDENIERVEVVRGGGSALFGSNTPGAIINFINKTGGPQVGGTMKVTAATEDLARYDFNLNGPFGDAWRFNVGGFYRYDHGVRDPGFPGIRGGQLKASVTRELPNGDATLSLKYIDDRNQFILPLPFQNPSDPQYVPGFGDYGSMNTNEGLDISIPIPTGRLTLPLGDGLRTKAYWLTLHTRFRFGDGWQVENAGQVMQNNQGWNAILTSQMFTASDFVTQTLSNIGLTADSTRLVFTNHFDQFGNHATFDTPNGLLSAGGEWHVEKPLTAFQDQLQVKKSFDRVDFSGGMYFATYTQGNRWFFTDILTDVRDIPQFVDLLAFTGPDTIHVTSNGFRNYLSNYVNGNGQASIFSAVGGASVRLTDRLRADLGYRYELNNFVQSSENTTTSDLDGDPQTVYDNETFGNGTFRHFDRTLHDWAGSVGLNYAVTPELSVYALGSRAYKMPALDEFLNAQAEAQVDLFGARRVYSGEGGVKYASRRVSFTVNGFYTVLKNIIGQGAVTDTLTGRTTWIITTSPQQRSRGVEVEGAVVPTPGLSVIGNATFLKADIGGGADIGSWINGVPPVIGNVAVRYTLPQTRLGLLGDWHLVGRRYSDFSNGTRLASYNYFNFGATYSIPSSGVTFSANLLNAFQSKGLEEGNPRLLGAGGSNLFFARPILPRRLMAAVGYQF
jgi:iron complex outermembrane receptor protein